MNAQIYSFDPGCQTEYDEGKIFFGTGAVVQMKGAEMGKGNKRERANGRINGPSTADHGGRGDQWGKKAFGLIAHSG